MQATTWVNRQNMKVSERNHEKTAETGKVLISQGMPGTMSSWKKQGRNLP